LKQINFLTATINAETLRALEESDESMPKIDVVRRVVEGVHSGEDVNDNQFLAFLIELFVSGLELADKR
jgi:hypothetical protein